MKELVIQKENGENVTTSLIVAEVFGKEHNKVCRDIETISCSDSFRVANFGETPYVHSQNGQTYKMYEMTKDGFSFLVMGYTGEKAGKFKEAFISEFNNREKMLKNEDYILARSHEILQNRIMIATQKIQILEGENEHLNQEVKQLAPKAEYTDKVLQSVSTYTMTQVAKELGMSAVALEKKLHDDGVMFRQSGQWILYARYQDKGDTKPRTHHYTHSDGTTGTNTITVWTEKGRKFIHELIKKQKSA
jgi:Rha family phage regulatory protein